MDDVPMGPPEPEDEPAPPINDYSAMLGDLQGDLPRST